MVAGVAILRTILAAYFLALATAIMLVPSKVAVLTAWMPDTAAMCLSVGVFGLCGLALLLKEAVRPAALCLSVSVAGLAFLQFEALSVADAQALFLRDIVVLGGLLVVSALDPLTARSKDSVKMRRVEPLVSRYDEGDTLRPNAFLGLSDLAEERLEEAPLGQPRNIFVAPSANQRPEQTPDRLPGQLAA